MSKGRNRQRTSRTLCYACASAADGMDHIPPRAIFPAKGVVSAEFGDLRRNLITVPACRAHNGDFSKDDEYVAAVLAVQLGNNRIAYELFAQKILGALVRSPRFGRRVLQGARPVMLGAIETGVIRIDLARFDRVMVRIAMGLYYHLTRVRLGAEVRYEVVAPPQGAP